MTLGSFAQPGGHPHSRGDIPTPDLEGHLSTPGRNLHALSNSRSNCPRSVSEVPALKKWNWTLYFYSIKCLSCHTDVSGWAVRATSSPVPASARKPPLNVSLRDGWVRLISALSNTKSSVTSLLHPPVTFVNWAKFELIYPSSGRTSCYTRAFQENRHTYFGCSWKCSYQRGLPRPSWQAFKV